MRTGASSCPAKRGRGTAPKGGGRGFGHAACSSAARPLHHANAIADALRRRSLRKVRRRSRLCPLPAPFHYAGADKPTRSRDAHAPEFCGTIRSPDAAKRNPGTALQLECCSRIARSLSSGRPLRAGPVGSIRATTTTTARKKEAERRQTCSANLRTLKGRGARAPQTSVRKSAHTKSATRARLSAFHRGSCCSERTPQLSSRYALPGTWSDARSQSFEQPGSKNRAFFRA